MCMNVLSKKETNYQQLNRSSITNPLSWYFFIIRLLFLFVVVVAVFILPLLLFLLFALSSSSLSPSLSCYCFFFLFTHKTMCISNISDVKIETVNERKKKQSITLSMYHAVHCIIINWSNYRHFLSSFSTSPTSSSSAIHSGLSFLLIMSLKLCSKSSSHNNLDIFFFVISTLLFLNWWNGIQVSYIGWLPYFPAKLSVNTKLFEICFFLDCSKISQKLCDWSEHFQQV